MVRLRKLRWMAESDVEVSTGVVVDLTEKTPIRVLHVDDDAVFLKVAKQCLEMEGNLKVETASSVEEALEKMKKKTFDTIVSDYVMPGKDGLEFLKDLRDSGNDAPFIIFTGRGREEVAIKALNLGADRYLNKGGDPETVYGELAHSIVQTVSRKRAEEMLRESEEKYRNLFENAKDVIVLMDLKGKVTSINKAAVEYGFKKDEVIGKNMRKFVPKKYWPKLLKELVQIARGKTVESRIEIITPKGRKDAEYRSDPMIVDNRVVGVQGVLRDITEHKKAEEELIRLSSAAKMTTDSIVISNLDGKIIDVNKATLKMYGTDDEKELIGKSSYDLIAPEDREKALVGMKETLEKGYVKGREYNIITKDGGRVPVEMSVALMKDVDGKPIGFVGISRDITERKRAEEKIKNLAKFPSENPNPVLRIAKDGTILYANNAGQSLLSGWKRGIGQPALDYLRRSIANSVSSGLEEEIEIKYRDRIFSFVLAPITDADYVNVYGRDITERKKMDEELKSSRERLNILFEFAPDAYYLNDLKGNFIDGNKAAEELTGYNKSELVGKSFLKLKLLPRSQMPKAAKLLAKNALGRPTGPDELTLNRKDGTQVSVEIRTFPVKIKDQTLVLGIARDITERKKAEEKFRLFSDSVKASINAIAINDLNGRFTYVNLAFEKMFGYSLEELTRMTIPQLVPKEALGQLMEEILPEIKKKGGWIGEGWGQRKDGTKFSISMSTSLVKDEKGKPIATLGSFIEITERKKAEKALRGTMEELKMTNEKMRVVGRLTRHDVRNKLSAVTGNIFLTKQKVSGDREALTCLKDAESAVRQVERIFDFARTYEKLGVEELAYMNVEKTVKEAVLLFSDLHGIKVINDSHGLTVLADSLLRQLFYNLIDNSLKYDEKASKIRIYYKEVRKDQLKLVYEDDGVGVSKSEKEKIFREGYGKGTGYGLYLIRKMCEVYGWTIRETGKHCKGAQFTVTIPKVDSKGKILYKLH